MACAALTVTRNPQHGDSEWSSLPLRGHNIRTNRLPKLLQTNSQETSVSMRKQTADFGCRVQQIRETGSLVPSLIVLLCSGGSVAHFLPPLLPFLIQRFIITELFKDLLIDLRFPSQEILC